MYKKFENKDWVKAYRPDGNIENYSDSLQKYKYVLCPEGNGYDTHRLWEVLYSGSIPVLKFHKSYSYGDSLPIIFLNDYKNLNIDYLDRAFNELKNQDFNLKKLTFQYWSELIIEYEKIKNSKTELYAENEDVIALENRNKKIKKLMNRLKIIRFYFWKIRMKLI